jgi:inositol oxygenase
LPNIIHSFQTAEGIRKAGKEDWMQLVGLIHDMGKIMFLWGNSEDGQEGTATGQQFALGGDTFVCGCAIPDTTVFPEFNSLNPDAQDARYNTELGIYEENCGLDNVMFAYGHDEYLYQMLKANGCTIPDEGLAMVRYHSAYPWHTGKSYRRLMNAKDEEMEKHVIDFNRFDLYTKDDREQLTREQVDALWPYYEGLINKYFPNPNELKW